MAGKFLRGALIEFNDSLPIPTPNIIIFQFNPEGMTNAWAAAGGAPAATGKGDAKAAGSSGDPLASAGNPVQSFTLDLQMSASDMIADGGVGGGLATVSGLYTRIAALEMLMFPVGAGGGGLLGSVSAAFGGKPPPTTGVPKAKVPMVLFVWGPGRIVPVRVTSLSIKETLYDPILLNPTEATASVGLEVLTPEALASATEGVLKDVAVAAWNINHALRQALAIANLANAVESSIGMLPF